MYCWVILTIALLFPLVRRSVRPFTPGSVLGERRSRRSGPLLAAPERLEFLELLCRQFARNLAAGHLFILDVTANVFHDFGIRECGRVPHVGEIGDGCDHPAHDLAGAGLRHIRDDPDVLRARDLPDLGLDRPDHFVRDALARGEPRLEGDIHLHRPAQGRQGAAEEPAVLRLPPRVDDDRLALADDAVIAAPHVRLDRLTDGGHVLESVARVSLDGPEPPCARGTSRLVDSPLSGADTRAASKLPECIVASPGWC